MRKIALSSALVALAILLAGTFGAVHDQVSFTVSREYFTRFKFIQFGLSASTLPERLRVAQVGFLASWFMGIPIGLIVARLAFPLPSDAVRFRFALRSFALILGITALAALGGLAFGCYRTAAAIRLADYDDWFIPVGLVHLRRYLCAGYMHNAAYLGGIGGTIGFAVFHYAASKLKKPRATYDC